jgi:nucleotide-binding universal stress UspA family protein
MPDYKTILVYVDFHGVHSQRLGVAAGLARRFGAGLLGVAAAQIPSSPTPLGGKRFKEFEQHEIEEQLDKLKDQFLAGAGTAKTVWQAHPGSPVRSVADQARDADLIVVSTHDGADMTAGDIGDLVMIAGRPVLVPAAGLRELSAARVLVAWKNTRESRRAVADAMPFLTGAESVVVTSVGKADDAEAGQDLDAVAAYLGTHGVKAASSLIAPDRGRRIADLLIGKAEAEGCDLVVAGAYGHSRFREIAFGGVTRDLLHQDKISVLLSN